MKERLQQLWSIALGLIILGALGAGAYFLISSLWTAFLGLDREIAAPLLTTAATVIVAVFTVVGGKQLEQRREIANQLRLQKIEVYRRFMEIWFEFLSNHTGTKSPHTKKRSEKDLAGYLHEFTSHLIMWGSSDVMRAFVAFRSSAVEEGQPPNPAVLVHFERVLFAMRKDIGHSNKDLKPGDLLMVFLNDPTNILDLVLPERAGTNH